MRIDPDTCRDPDLLAAEVRRLQGVIAAGEAAITDEERAPRTYRKTDGKRPILDMGGVWIPVTERLPPVGQPVLVVALGRVITATRKEGNWWRHEIDTGTQTFSLGVCTPKFWMPLPAPPTGSK
jgi:hypothetical protein